MWEMVLHTGERVRITLLSLILSLFLFPFSSVPLSLLFSVHLPLSLSLSLPQFPSAFLPVSLSLSLFLPRSHLRSSLTPRPFRPLRAISRTPLAAGFFSKSLI